MPPDALIFSSKCTQMRLVAGQSPDPLGEPKRSPRPPSRKKGGQLLRGGDGRERGREVRKEEKEEWREGKGKGGEGKGALLISGQRGLFP